jgi:hypothetical protein
VEREPPPVTVTAPGSGAAPPDVLEAAPARPARLRLAAGLGVLAVAVVGAAVGLGGSDPASRPALERTPASGITATASLAGAPTDDPYTQRMTLVIDLPAADGPGEGAEVGLVDVRLRGFSVERDDAREVLPLGRFGRADRGRSTTVPVTALLEDCSIEPQARRDIDLTLRTGDGPDGAVRAVVEADVVRALDRLVGRACRRPRG